MFVLKKLSILLFIIAAISLSAADSLPSWNEGASKNAILDFVKEVTDKSSKNFVPVEERIATFDQDGTLWVEQPLYPQLIFAVDTFKNSPNNKDQSLKSKLNAGLEKLTSLTKEEREELLVKTHAGMTVEEFQNTVSDWIKTALHPRFKKPFTELIYQPMLEVIRLLQENEFKVYIVSGGGQEFIRVFAEPVYGIPPEKVIGSVGKVKYTYQNQKPVLMKLPSVLIIDDKEGKPEDINMFIGRRPIASFGNSDGDQQMLEWTEAGKGKRLELLVHHDDAEREYAYDADSKIGTFSKALMNEAQNRGWIVVSMKRDWKTIFPTNEKK
jgi:phosphoglycolate phosphatase-like HAD superfamily hydrolase